jgi:HAD superfamily hydrolase (TIGR01509 family)
MTTPLRAAVFDLDGLLVDSEPIQIASWNAFLARHGQVLDEALLGRLFGLRIWDTARLLIDLFALPLTVDEVIKERDAIFFAALRDNVRSMPGARELVRRLRERGLRWGLATSGHRAYADVALEGIGLADAFDVEVTGGEVAHGKPAPDIYLSTARQLGVPPAACVAFEDAPHGVASAKDAGMLCLAVPNAMTASLGGFERADSVLNSLDDAICWLDARDLLPVAQA